MQVTPRRRRNLYFFGWAIIACLTMTGCGGGNAHVSGIVTVDGDPAPACFLFFEAIAPDGRNATGRTDANGQYKGYSSKNDRWMKPGEYKVEINSEADIMAADGEPFDPNGLRIPRKYKGENSELKVTVKSGSTTVDFELTSD